MGHVGPLWKNFNLSLVDLDPYAPTSQARSVLQDLCLNILPYERKTRLINSKYYFKQQLRRFVCTPSIRFRLQFSSNERFGMYVETKTRVSSKPVSSLPFVQGALALSMQFLINSSG